MNRVEPPTAVPGLGAHRTAPDQHRSLASDDRLGLEVETDLPKPSSSGEACGLRVWRITADDSLHREMADVTGPFAAAQQQLIRPQVVKLQALFDRIGQQATTPVDFEHLQVVFESLSAELEKHLITREQVLFPLLESLKAADELGANECQQLQEAIASAHADAAMIERSLVILRDLTNDYTATGAADGLYKVLLHELRLFETRLKRLIRLQADVLIPYAIATKAAALWME